MRQQRYQLSLAPAQRNQTRRQQRVGDGLFKPYLPLHDLSKALSVGAFRQGLAQDTPNPEAHCLISERDRDAVGPEDRGTAIRQVSEVPQYPKIHLRKPVDRQQIWRSYSRALEQRPDIRETTHELHPSVRLRQRFETFGQNRLL